MAQRTLLTNGRLPVGELEERQTVIVHMLLHCEELTREQYDALVAIALETPTTPLLRRALGLSPEADVMCPKCRSHFNPQR